MLQVMARPTRPPGIPPIQPVAAARTIGANERRVTTAALNDGDGHPLLALAVRDRDPRCVGVDFDREVRPTPRAPSTRIERLRAVQLEDVEPRVGLAKILGGVALTATRTRTACSEPGHGVELSVKSPRVVGRGVAMITDTPRCANSAASCGKRSNLPSAYRYSNMTLRFST